MVVRFVVAFAALWMLTTGLCSSFFLIEFIDAARQPYKGGDGFKIGWSEVAFPAVSLLLGVGSGYVVYRWAKKREARHLRRK